MRSQPVACAFFISPPGYKHLEGSGSSGGAPKGKGASPPHQTGHLRACPPHWPRASERTVRLRSQPWHEVRWPRLTVITKCWGVLLRPSPTSANPIHLHNNPEALHQQSAPPWGCLVVSGDVLDAAAGRGVWLAPVGQGHGGRYTRSNAGQPPQPTVIQAKELFARLRHTPRGPVAVIICLQRKKPRLEGRVLKPAPVWHVGL